MHNESKRGIMAKKRKKQEELKAEKDYKPPKFDKEEYMRTEINVAKGTVYAAVMAIPMAVVAMFTLPVGGVGGGLLIGLAGISLMWFLLPLLKVDINSFKITHWLGAISTYFFLFLAIWVMLCNPPFNDFASPAITDLEVSWDGGDNWQSVNATETGSMVISMPENATVNLTMFIRAHVTDNSDLDESSVMIDYGAGPIQMTAGADDYFTLEVPNPVELMSLTITASDVKGNDPTSYTFSIAA